MTDKKMEMTWWGADSIQNNIKKSCMNFIWLPAKHSIQTEMSPTASRIKTIFNYELYKKTGDSYEPAMTRITNFDGTGNRARVTAPINTQVINGVSLKTKSNRSGGRRIQASAVWMGSS
ncbi:hypothetical protein ACFTAO_04740 [Paenibacillus rhizoplanae]